MENKIRIAAVSYFNTRPLIYAFEKGAMSDLIELDFGYPSEVAGRLLKNEADIGLVPVEVLTELYPHFIISDYCIGTEGEVASVCLFSEVPLEEISVIMLDYQSRTSVALLKILLKHFWKISPQLTAASAGYEAEIKGTTAGLVIGDRALALHKKVRYQYDLGLAWREMTGLPFVFAAWVANKKLPAEFIREFNQATASGLNHLAEIAESINYPQYNLLHYFQKNISYQLDESKMKALELFFGLIRNEQ